MRFTPVVLHTPLVIVVAMTLWLTGDPVMTLTVGGLLSIPTYLFLGWLEARRAPLWLSPLSFYFLWYSVCFGPSALHIAGRIDRGDSIGFSVTYVHGDNIAPAYLIYLIGSLALHAGTQILRPLARGGADSAGSSDLLDARGDASDGAPAREGAAVFGFALLWAAGIIVRLFGPQLEFLGAVRGVLNWAPLAGLSAYAITRGASSRRDLWFWVLLAIGTAVEMAFSIRTGSKAYIMFSFIPAVWLLSRERTLRRLLLPLGAALVVFYVAIVAPVVTTSRRTPWTPSDSHTDRIVNTYIEGSYEASADFSDQMETFFERQFDPIPVAFLHREVERTGLRYGDTMDYLLYAFIPRFLWEGKPSVTRGGWFTLYLGQARKESDVSTSTGQTAVGELYWNFGLPGVIVGMGALGFLMGGLWRMSRARAHEEALLFLLYVSLCFGMLDMPEAGTVLVGLVHRALVIGTLVWFIRYIAPLLPRRV